MAAPPSDAPRRFELARDSFAFANELFWEYHRDARGAMSFQPRHPKPDYAHRCFVLARAARQFLYHARFDPDPAPLDELACRQRVRRVMARSPRQECAPAGRIVFPGFAGLRDFSRAHEALLKAECGGAWRSYVLRSHWRMVFPISREHQALTAAGLIAALDRGLTSLVHLVQFPALTINHGMLLFAVAGATDQPEFAAYDPNDPARPARITFDRGTGRFSLPANRYWGGGHLNLIEIYRNWWF